MLSHHAQKHSGSVRVRVDCGNCGEELHRPIYWVKRNENMFCGKGCSKEWKAGREAPPDHNFRNGGKVEYTCDYCGDVDEKYPSQLAQSEKSFCGQDCANDWKRGRDVPDTHNFYKGGFATVECEWCGEELERRPCKLERSENFFCGDTDCQAKWQSKNLRRENHPNWKGGHEFDYGPNWNRQRDKRIEHDGYECVVCGLSNGQHMELHDCNLHVHHIQRKEAFRKSDGSLDYERANRLENLITLCYTCHNRWEGIPLRPQA